MAQAQTATTTTGAPAPEHAPGFPPFESETFASQLLWLALTFGALYLFLVKVGLPRLGGVIENRHKRIARDLDHAAAMKKRSEEAAAAYEKALAEARTNAHAIAQGTRDKLSAEAAAKRKELETDVAQKVATAEKTIAATKRDAMASVEGIALDAASAIIERIVGQAPAPSAVSAAVRSALKA